MTPTMSVPRRVFLPLAESPLATVDTDAHGDLAVSLAATAELDPATVAALLSITHPDVADRVAHALVDRGDLSVAMLGRLLATHPDLAAAAARLRALLFPDGHGCHRVTRALAGLAYRPDRLDPEFLGTDRFTTALAHVDPDTAAELLAPVLADQEVSAPAVAGLAAVLAARHHELVTAFDVAVEAAVTRARLTGVRAALAARRAALVADLAEHTGGLTRAPQAWFDTLAAAVSTAEQAEHAAAVADHAVTALAQRTDSPCSWPAVRHRWHQVTAAADLVREPFATRWRDAWTAAEHTDDGALWHPVQRGLVTGYDLLASHVRDTYGDDPTPPTPQRCWGTDPAGRGLLHAVADHLTGYEGHSPLDHFTDDQLVRFVHGLAKSRRDRVPGFLQITGLIAAARAARSKTHLLTATGPCRIGIVIPTRGEAHHIRPGAPDGQDALAVKLHQVAWLLHARPDAHVTVLLVDEDPDGASARAAAEVTTTHPRIGLDIATRPAAGQSTKGGAVLWGLAQLLDTGCTTVAYTDLDLTYPLDQLGLLLDALDRPGVAAAIGSRTLPSSHGYYPPGGPPRPTVLYRRAVGELLSLDVGDPQAGFKAFAPAPLRAALPRVLDQRLSFDSELLAVLHHDGHQIAETGVVALHHYLDGRTPATPRDYDAMLTEVRRQAARHGLDQGQRWRPVCEAITAAGSLAAAAEAEAGTPRRHGVGLPTP
ncbi:hypothetical protein [Umezawaea sp. Da 62-37]|uniref:hypothetical protein n=1 Tax=Umezawaea sp. Da 62-37 TaxID=3075927 RepID=UPI0028F6E8A3|nr:hypothetical protein [Umezawaea sp. Da 62-37]WNV84740.1 hypothetical protein RM788_42350 [Umezawaea sp. Da 62-37]